MRFRRGVLREPVTVRTFRGQSGRGPVYAQPRTVLVDVDASRALVRGPDGAEVTSEARLIAHPRPRLVDVDPPADVDPLELFTPESQVTVRGRVADVISVKPHTSRGRVHLVEVALS